MTEDDRVDIQSERQMKLPTTARLASAALFLAVDTATKKPGAPLVSGGLGLQSEGREVIYRNFPLRKLEK